MRFASFIIDGRATWGRVQGDTILDCATDDLPDLKSAIARDAMSRADGPAIRRSRVRLLPVIPNPSKVLCVGHNYESHRVETARDKTEHPSIFTRFPDTLVGADDPIVRPRVSHDLDFEAELAIVIGKGGISPKPTPWTMSQDLPASTTPRCATGNGTRASSRPARTSPAPRLSDPSW